MSSFLQQKLQARQQTTDYQVSDFWTGANKCIRPPMQLMENLCLLKVVCFLEYFVKRLKIHTKHRTTYIFIYCYITFTKFDQT